MDSIPRISDSVNTNYSISVESAESPDVEEIETDTEQELTDRDLLLAMAEQLVGNEQEAKILADYKDKYDEQKARQKTLDEILAEIDNQRSILYNDPEFEKRSNAAKRLKDLYKEMNDVSQELADVNGELVKIEELKAVRNWLVRERKNLKENLSRKIPKNF